MNLQACLDVLPIPLAIIGLGFYLKPEWMAQTGGQRTEDRKAELKRAGLFVITAMVGIYLARLAVAEFPLLLEKISH